MLIILIVLLLHLLSSSARLNFYLDTNAVNEIFGIGDFQLFFVENDHIRLSALKSPIQISSEIDFVQFTWQNDDRSKLFYEFNSSSTDSNVLLPPLFNIEEKGLVPHDASTFSLFFPCQRKRSANVSIVFHFFNSTKSIIKIQFEKFCRNQLINRSLLNGFFHLDEYFFLHESHLGIFSSSTIGSILIYSILIAFLVFILVFCTAMSFFCLYRMTTKKGSKRESLMDNAHPALPLTFDMTTFEDVSLYSCTQYDFFKSPDEILSSATFADLTIDANRLTLHETIVEGTYGRILNSSLDEFSSTNIRQKTLAKTLHLTATVSQFNEMLRDCCLFAPLKHATINSPLGIVYKEDFAPYPLIIYPSSNKGILKRFLIDNRTRSREQMLSTQELVYMGIHIGKGLHFLHRRKMLMKDIGTRNCLLMDDLTVKLMDYALSSDVFPQDYETIQTENGEERRPLKFMAIESIEDRRFSTASDVWSYGILLWELMTRGLQPFADINAEDLVEHLKNHHRLSQPTNCPDSLFKLMNICWVNAIDQRPSMATLLQSMIEFYSQLSRFI